MAGVDRRMQRIFKDVGALNAEFQSAGAWVFAGGLQPPATSTAVVALNRAIALAEISGPAAGLAATDGLDLCSYHLFHAVRADLLRRLGRTAEAAQAYEAALALTANAAERAFLERQRNALPSPR
jgi:predicted RNA polymerase sigma factor